MTDACAIGNTPCVYQRLLQKRSDQNRVRKDGDPVVSRGEHLTIPMFNQANVPTGSLINSGDSSASWFRCPMLEDDMEYKPEKGKVAVGMIMPNLGVAMEELYRLLVSANPGLRFHPALKRRWAPAVCRLMEMHWRIQHPE